MKLLRIVLLVITFAFANIALGQTVYTTKTGGKYHKSNCRYLKYSKKEYKLDKAIALGFSACSVCKPNKNNTKIKSSGFRENSTSTPNNNIKKATAGQCTGKTKAGKRCKRKTKSANQRCYQH